MKAYGDIPAKHLELVGELEALEQWFSEHGDEVPPIMAAKVLVSMGHDYYQIHMEEKGETLLRRAEKHYPGYFKNAILAHAEKDGDFYQLLLQIKETLALETMKSLGFDEEQI